MELIVCLTCADAGRCSKKKPSQWAQETDFVRGVSNGPLLRKRITIKQGCSLLKKLSGSLVESERLPESFIDCGIRSNAVTGKVPMVGRSIQAGARSANITWARISVFVLAVDVNQLLFGIKLIEESLVGETRELWERENWWNGLSFARFH